MKTYFLALVCFWNSCGLCGLAQPYNLAGVRPGYSSQKVLTIRGRPERVAKNGKVEVWIYFKKPAVNVTIENGSVAQIEGTTLLRGNEACLKRGDKADRLLAVLGKPLEKGGLSHPGSWKFKVAGGYIYAVVLENEVVESFRLTPGDGKSNYPPASPVKQ